MLLTDGAAMGRVLHVKDFVHRERSRLAKSLATFTAFKRFFFGVDVSVVSQVVLTTERLSADITVEWPFVGVGALVNEQVVRLGELAVAILANKSLLGPR